MNTEDFIKFDELYTNTYEGWGDAPCTVWDTSDMSDPKVVAEGDNPYELMDVFALHGVTQEAVCAIRGWGAPLDKDGNHDESIRPSLHPERKRLFLYMHLKHGSNDVTVAMHQEGDSVVVMDETGIGSLADAVQEAIERVKNALNMIKEEV